MLPIWMFSDSENILVIIHEMFSNEKVENERITIVLASGVSK